MRNEKVEKSFSYITVLCNLLKTIPTRNDIQNQGIFNLRSKILPFLRDSKLTKKTRENAIKACEVSIGCENLSPYHLLFQRIKSEIEEISNLMEEDGAAQTEFKETSIADSKLILFKKSLTDAKESLLAILSLNQFFNWGLGLDQIKRLTNTPEISLQCLLMPQIDIDDTKVVMSQRLSAIKDKDKEKEKKNVKIIKSIKILNNDCFRKILNAMQQELNTEPYFIFHPTITLFGIFNSLNIIFQGGEQLIIEYCFDPENLLKDYCGAKLKHFLEFKKANKASAASACHQDHILADLCKIHDSVLENKILNREELKFFRESFPISKIATVVDLVKLCLGEEWPDAIRSKYPKAYLYNPYKALEQLLSGEDFYKEEEYACGIGNVVNQLGQKIFEELRSLWLQFLQIEESYSIITCYNSIKQQKLNQKLSFDQSPLTRRPIYTLFENLHTGLNLTKGVVFLIIDYYQNYTEINLLEEDFEYLFAEILKPVLNYIDVYHTRPRGIAGNPYNKALRELCQIFDSYLNNKELDPKYFEFFRNHFPAPRIVTAQDIGTLFLEKWGRQSGDNVEQFLMYYFDAEDDKRLIKEIFADFNKLWKRWNITLSEELSKKSSTEKQSSETCHPPAILGYARLPQLLFNNAGSTPIEELISASAKTLIF